MTRKKVRLVSMVALIISSMALVKMPSIPPDMLPGVNVTRFSIHSISLQDVTFLFDVSVTNPYPVALKLDHLGLKYAVEGKNLLSTKTEKGFSVPARRSKTNRFLVTLAYDDIMAAVSNYSSRDYLDTNVHITAALPLPSAPGLPPTYNFYHEARQKIPALKPTVNVVNFRVEQPSRADVQRALDRARSSADPGVVANMFSSLFAGRTGALPVDPSELDVPIGVFFDVILTNGTKAELPLKGLDFQFYVNGEPLVNGRTEAIVKKGSRYHVSIANSFSSKALSSSVLKAFRDGAGDYRFEGLASLMLPASVSSKPVDLKFSEKGRFATK